MKNQNWTLIKNQLKDGKTVSMHIHGNSMTPVIQSGQEVTIVPFDGMVMLGDVVLCKVGKKMYLHLILTIRNSEVLIGNNHGHINGWIPTSQIYGKWLYRPLPNTDKVAHGDNNSDIVEKGEKDNEILSLE